MAGRPAKGTPEWQAKQDEKQRKLEEAVAKRRKLAKSNNVSIMNEKKYDKSNIFVQKQNLDTIKFGLTKAAIEKHGSMEGWFEHMMNLAHESPAFTAKLMEYTFGKVPNQIEDITTNIVDNTILLGYLTLEDESTDKSSDI